MSAALKSRPLRWIGALYGLGSALDWALSMALMVFVYGRTGSPMAAGAMLVCSQVAPGLLIGLLAERADRWDFRRALACAFALQGLAVLLLVVLSLPIYGAAIGVGLCGAVVRSQLRSGLAQVAHGDLFRAGSALLNGIRGVTSLAGPALAAASLATFGPDATLLVVGAALVASGGLGLVMTRLVIDTAGTGADSECADAATTRVSRPVAPLLLLVGFVLAAMSVDEPALLAYVERGLGDGVGGYGALLTAWGVGTLIGTALFTRVLGRPMLQVFAGAMGVSALAHAGLYVAPSLPFAVAAAVLGGAANGMDWAALSTAVMERAAIGDEGRVAARLEAVATTAPALGFVVGGAMAASLAPRLVLLVPAAAGALILLGFVIQWLFRRRGDVPLLVPSYRSEVTPRGI